MDRKRDRWKRIGTAANIAAVVMVTVIIGGGIASYSQLQGLTESRMWVLHTYQVMTALQETKADVLIAESASESFLITKNNDYERQYKDAKAASLNLTHLIDGMLDDNPQQQQALVRLRRKMGEHFRDLEAAMALKVAGDKVNASELLSFKASGNRAAIITIVEDMRAHEQGLLNSRTEDLQRNSQKTFLFVSLVASLAVAFQLIMVAFTSYWINQNKRAQAQIAATVSSMTEGVYQVDRDGNLQFMNPAAEALLGYRLDDIRGRNMHELIHSKLADGSPRGKDTCPIVNVVLTGKSHQETSDVYIHADGHYIPVEYSSTPLIANDIIEGAVVVFSDITDKLAVDKRLSEFYSIISHELRTPLTSIRAALGLIEGGVAGQLTPRGQQLVSIGRAESDRLVRLINDILDMKKIEAGKLELNLETTDPHQLVDSTIEALASLGAAQGVHIASDCLSSSDVNADKDRIAQVITNLISNAIKFSPKGSTILVRTTDDGSSVKFEIRDRGEGIPKQKLGLLFGMFQQIDSTDARAKGGTGLGLAISKSIIEAHGGEIGVLTEEGAGSTFWFTLPSSMPEARLQQAMDECNLLIIEDDEQLAKMLAETLQDVAPNVAIHTTLTKGREFLKTTIPQSIILDLTLPDGDGLSLLDELRSDSRLDSIPVIILTGRPEDKNISHPVLMDWIQKPFQPDRLQAALKRAQMLQHRKTGLVLIVDDDESTRELIRQQLQELSLNCIQAATGLDAIEMAISQKPDLIILDVLLPDKSGFEVVAALRENESTRQTSIVVYTAKDLDEDEKRNLTLGLTSCLTKSRTSETEFLSSVKNLLSNVRQNNQTAQDS